MTASAFLDLCLKGEDALESALEQLQKAGHRDVFKNGPLKLHADGHHLQLSVSELAAALSGRIGSSEDELARIAQSASLQDDGPSGTSKPGQGSEGKGHNTHNASSSASFPYKHKSTGSSFNERVDGASLEPGKLDMASFPSLGSAGQQKVGSVLLMTCLTALTSNAKDPAALLFQIATT